MKRNSFNELQAKTANEKPPLKGSPWRPDIQDLANEPEGLRKFVFDLQTMITGNLIEDQLMGMDWFYEQTRDLLILKFESWMYGEIVDTHTVKYPRDWFQHLKQRVLPRALEKYWPVKYKIVEIEIQALYPGLRKKLHFPNEKNVIHVVRKEYDEEE